MTTVITRYFESAAQARLVRTEMVRQNRFPARIVRVFEAADGLTETLTAADVDRNAAQTYEKHVAKGGAVVMVRAGYKPLGVAKIARTLMAEMGAQDLGNIQQEVAISDGVPVRSSVLLDHPLMLSRERDPYSSDYHMANWPIPLISRRKPFDDAVIPRHGRMASWPFPLISRRQPYTKSMIDPPHKRMADFPIPLLSDRKPSDKMAISRHGRMANFPIPLISKRKPYTGSLIPRHGRMATVPFPLLMNGKTGTHTLMPNGPRMANFPIPLLSGRKPFTGSIVGKHSRMANFPMPLLSGRKPYDEMAIPRHGRMADRLLPLVIKHADSAQKGSSNGFSLSKFFGLPTLIRR